MITIIGGGASGIVAAIAARRNGADVRIIERLNRIGKKILTTGNGRCNMTNTNMSGKKYHSSTYSDFDSVLSRFDEKQVLEFFSELGIMHLIEGTKVYPMSEQASSVVDVLRMELERLDIEVISDTLIIDIKKKKSGWLLIDSEGNGYETDKVIVATGGMANNALGCDGTGYKLLQGLGHTLIKPLPVLVHLTSSSPYPKMMKGTRVIAKAKILADGKFLREETDEVLFTEDGVSGPCIFLLSSQASRALGKKQNVVMLLDMLPNMSGDELVSILYERINNHPERTIEYLLLGMINKRISIPIMKMADIKCQTRRLDELEYDEIERIVKAIKAFRIEIDGTRSFKFAQATAGGINMKEIDTNTMLSKLAKNVYITGEVMDVDGDCGGYNLQWAWTTGYIAGVSAAQCN